jgi:hypothetical protein
MALIQPQASRAADVIEQQRRFPGITDAGDKVLLNFRPVEQLDLTEEVRYKLSIGRYGRVGAMPVVVVQTGINDGIANGMATVAAELARLTEYFKRRGRLTFRYRQAAMKTERIRR